mmetsp:Transcript_66943/g.157932  ORF Transcript_66943/g.157932 Transcript_66943/m.157932 type:complete len:94 (+) Transcript_66943:264-545(+)
METLEQRRLLAWELKQEEHKKAAEEARQKQEEIEKKRAADKLEDMMAANEGRSSKARPKTETKDYRDGSAWDFTPGRGGGGGFSSFKPRPRGG